ncbi:MAG: divergent PAP2 family protein [Clostridium sp.]|nr:divergent PAP2 family protein [Clostridium sp.]
MVFLAGLIHNPVLVAGVLGWFVAQVLKTIIHLLITKQFVWERMVGSGGMPSSHSATVCALATAAGIQYGSESFAFAISVIMAIIVMHDAMGVRRETGIQARVLNEMMTLFREMGTKMSVEDKLKEFVGHTPLQVWIGALLGIVIGFLTCQFMLPL